MSRILGCLLCAPEPTGAHPDNKLSGLPKSAAPVTVFPFSRPALRLRFPTVMRLLLATACLLVLSAATAFAQNREDIVLTGGPALRFMEHGKGDVSHDVYWFNFVDASTIRLKEIKDGAKPNETVTWLIYRPSYAARSKEMGLDLLAQLQEKAKALGVRLVWFNSKAELVAYLNKGMDRSTIKIGSFDYFGHSNKACFLFDYSNTIDTMSVAWLHVKDLKLINSDVFAEDAVCKSWGCHSGEMYSKWWKNQFDVPMIGAIGKTDFAHGGLPQLSNTDGKWAD
jgi:hypothetical protein